jgi:hypothetical protein
MTGLLRVVATENPAGRFLSINIASGNFKSMDGELVDSIVVRDLPLQWAVKPGEAWVHYEFAWQDGYMWVSHVILNAELGDYGGYNQDAVPSRLRHALYS